MNDETPPEPITYLLRRSGCISGQTECCFEVAIQKARNMPLGTEVVELYEWPEKLIARLRADLAAVTAERDRMREALRPFADAVDIFIAEKHDAHRTIVTLGDFFHARAALEGVTEPVALWQHKKTGGVYEIVGECQIEATNAPGVLYRNTSTGVTWMRPKEEFFDGRFVEWRKPEPSI